MGDLLDQTKAAEGWPADLSRAVSAFRSGRNQPRDRQIADRLEELGSDALDEGERILLPSIDQFRAFFLDKPGLALPIITLTPDGTLRARWMRSADEVFAVEFTGEPLLRILSRVPRPDGEVAELVAEKTPEMAARIGQTIGAPLL